jgi:hypothetical protein
VLDMLKFNEMKYMREKMPIYLIGGDGAQKKIFIYFIF